MKKKLIEEKKDKSRKEFWIVNSLIMGFILVWLFLIWLFIGIYSQSQPTYIINQTTCWNETTAYDGCVLGCSTGIIGSTKEYTINEAIDLCKIVCEDLIKQKCETKEVDSMILGNSCTNQEDCSDNEIEVDCNNIDGIPDKLKDGSWTCCKSIIKKQDITKEWLESNCHKITLCDNGLRVETTENSQIESVTSSESKCSFKWSCFDEYGVSLK